MTVEDQIRYLQSKIASLEAKLASSQSQADNPTTEGRLLGTLQQTVDPQGRKIWEAEWRGDYKVMMAYVPDNALIIDGQNVAVEADDKEGSEMTLSDGSWYLHAYKNKTTGNWEAELDQEPTGTREDEEAKYNIHICDINKDGYIEKQYVVGSIVIGGAGSKFVGDDEEGASEEIDSSDGVIHLQGFKGEADGERTGNSGLEFLTVGARKGGNGEKIPPKAIIDIKGRATASGCGNTENWGCHSLKKDGNLLGHFLGCRDIDIIKEGGGGGGGGDTVVGSDYIEIADEQDPTDPTKTNKAIKAKVSTPANQGDANNPNAVLTHNTDQFVRSKKTFLGVGQDNAQKKVVIDGPNGKVEVQNAAGDRIIKLDAADIPNECGQGGAATLQVHKLTVTHPRAKDGKTADIYHIIGCTDIDIQEGDAIDTITSGTPTQSGGFTLTPVTIRLKDGTSLPAFNVSAKNGADGVDGADGEDGDPAGFGTPTAAATDLEPGSTPTVQVTASGPDTAKVFSFVFGIPKGKNVQSDWDAESGEAAILNKPESLKNPESLTLKKTGSQDVVYDGSSPKTFEITSKNLVAGSGISLTTSGNNITITNTREGGGVTTEGITETVPFIDGFKYDKTTHKLMYRFGSIRYENGLAVEYTPGGDDDFVDVPGGDAVVETV